MTRKQIYITETQAIQLKQMAKARGVSESQIIREAIDAQISGAANVLSPDHEAFEEMLQIALSRRQLAGGEPYKWNRQDAYEEREEALAVHLAREAPKSS